MLNVVHLAVLTTVVSGLAIGEVQGQSNAAANPPITIKDCYRVIKNDSVELSYDDYYRLAPTACAQIRRYCHINSKGNLHGRVEDVQAASGQVVLRGQYTDNQRDGLFEAFDAQTGQRRWRGAFAQGRPQGEWQYWYADGRPQQVIHYEPTGLKLWQCWNEQGQQLLTDGNGTWRETNGGGWRGGPVVGGVPTGRWESHGGQGFGDKQPLLAVETFDKGQFRKGQVMFSLPGAEAVYRNESRLLPLRPSEAYQAAEEFRLGVSCEQQRQRASRAAMRMPAWQGGSTATLEQQVVQNINAQPQHWPAGVDHLKLTATIDAQGRLVNPKVVPAEAQGAAAWLDNLRQWEPARRGDQAIPGTLEVEVHRESARSFRVQARPGVSMNEVK